MPRQRYPSDEARVKTRPHVQVHLSARNHRIMGPLFANEESRAVITGLWMAAFQAHATATGDIVLLTHADLCWVGCRRNVGAAAKVVAKVCAQAGYRVWFHPRSGPVPSWTQLRSELDSAPTQPGSSPSPVPTHFGATSIHVRNLLKKQITNSATRGDATRHSRPSDTPNTDTPNTDTSRGVRAPDLEQKSRADPPEGATRCAQVLIDCVREAPGGRIPPGALRRWARQIANIPAEVPELQNGGDPWDHIEAAIRWALGPENLGKDYEVVIRCGRSLRDKWSTLVAAAQRARKRTQPLEEFERWMHSQA